MKKLKIYLATPVNGRQEATLKEKREAAYKRVKEMSELIRRKHPDAELHSSFDDDISPIGGVVWSEAGIMGLCVMRVMECDMVVMDSGWQVSRGCTVESFVAIQYGKNVLPIEWYLAQDGKEG